jgi:two-component system cell cycle response regulator
MARILVIEDNPENLELMTYLLRAFGHETMTSESGKPGVDIARLERPDLIACDVQLPDMDGYEVVRRLKAIPTLSDVPVVAVTALAMSGDREKGLAQGFDGYISKPIDPERFVALLEAFLPEAKRGRVPTAQPETLDSGAASPQALIARILVVDDSATNRELIYQTLVPFGYEVHLSHTVHAAMEFASSNDLDLILSDLHMPGEDGFNFVRRVKADARLAKLPFMFISSSVWGEQERTLAMQLGVSRFLLRPIEPQVLLDEVAACLARQREVSHGENPRR